MIVADDLVIVDPEVPWPATTDVARALDALAERDPDLALVLDHIGQTQDRILGHIDRVSHLVEAGEQVLSQVPKGGGMMGLLGPMLSMMKG